MAKFFQRFRNFKSKIISKEYLQLHQKFSYHFENKICPLVKCDFSDDCTEEKSKYGDNMSVVLHGIKDLKIEKRPLPKFKENQVLLQMEVVGICGSDVHYYDHGKIGPFVVRKPMVIGHEGSATVLECGKEVKHLKPGDKVALEPQINCRKCYFCKTGNYNLCQNLFFCATPPDDGNLSTYWAHDADFCYKLPENMTLEQGALMEPLAVGVHACKRANICQGDTVLILGAGPIGLVSLLAARAYGAKRIVITDVLDFRLHKAVELGADCAIKVTGLHEDNIIEMLSDALKDERPRVTIYCCSDEMILKTALKLTRTGGKVILVGMPSTEYATIPTAECVIREVDLLGVFRYVNDYPSAIDMVSSGKVNPKPLITHHFKMADSVNAFEMASEKTEKFIKIVIHANPNWTSIC